MATVRIARWSEWGRWRERKTLSNWNPLESPNRVARKGRIFDVQETFGLDIETLSIGPSRFLIEELELRYGRRPKGGGPKPLEAHRTRHWSRSFKTREAAFAEIEAIVAAGQ